MKAIILNAINTPLNMTELPKPEKKEGEKHIRIAYAALNHRDVWITKGQYASIVTPIVLGSDGSGYDEDENEVIINPGFDFGNDERAQGNRFNMLGMPANGTLAQYVSVHQKYIFPKPEHLTLEQAAALPLAGLTAYRALFVRGMYQPEERVLITGIGGGVALFAMQYALACGSEVWVTSSSDEKIARAVEMGAKGGVNYKDENWHKSLTEKKIFFDVIVDGAAGAGFSKLLTVCNPGARIAVYGGTAGKIESISPQVLFWKQITIAGSTMGSEKDFAEMLAFVNEKKIVPVVSKTFEMEEAQAAFDYMGKGEQFGKPVIRID
jgi:zinc-binding alcohol dehydrogenase/oxidoreductase